MNWINILHLYQPPTQELEILDKVAKESYREIIKILREHPSLKFTVNITGCLTSRLAKEGYQDIIEEFKKLAESGQIELIGSAAFHPILPLLPAHEIEKQIQMNDDINKKYFGSAYQPQGFYLPELAYSNKVAKIIKKAGFKWIVLDEISLNGKLGQVDNNIKYSIKNIGLRVVFRNREISKTFVPATLLEIFEEIEKPPLPPPSTSSGQALTGGKRALPPVRGESVITATDGELYGHHHQDWENKLDRLLANSHLATLTVSEYLSKLKKEKNISPVKSSWESTEEELQNKNYYPLWNDPQNKIHKKLWQLAKMAIKINDEHKDDVNHYVSRLHLEKGIASCAFWWCSDRKPSPFCPPTWSPDEVEKGIENLIRSIRTLENLDPKQKQEAEKIYLSIKKMIWQTHWDKESNSL